MKKGRLSLEELEYIENHLDVLTIEQIAKDLDREFSSIKKCVDLKIGLNQQQKKEISASHELRAKPYWGQLQKQFNEEELEEFAFHWRKMWSQFKDDVFHTEELQIVDVIKLGILMDRCLVKKFNIDSDLVRMRDILDKEKEKDKSDRDDDLITSLERRIDTFDVNHRSISSEYKDLHARRSSMLQSLKGTREQRIKDIESARQTFAGFLKEINSNPQYRREVGLEMERARLAMYKERERLSKEHTYVDGSVDQPFLNHETVI